MQQIAKKMVRVNGKKKLLTLGLKIDISSDGQFTASGDFKFNGNEG